MFSLQELVNMSASVLRTSGKRCHGIILQKDVCNVIIDTLLRVTYAVCRLAEFPEVRAVYFRGCDAECEIKDSFLLQRIHFQKSYAN